MQKFKTALQYFSRTEKAIWGSSVALVVVSYLLFDGSSTLTLVGSLVGVTSLIFNAKGNPIGQALAIVFSVVYAIVSYSYSYYGEMVTYLGMTAPMALISLIAWLRNPYQGNLAEVKVNRLKGREVALMFLLAAVVTVVFYYVLKAFDTANLVPSTLSVSTSFLAVYMTFRRSPYYAIAYCANDTILILMWILATRTDVSYLSVIVCFVTFLVNDVYGFINWRSMQARQRNATPQD